MDSRQLLLHVKKAIRLARARDGNKYDAIDFAIKNVHYRQKPIIQRLVNQYWGTIRSINDEA